MQLEFCSLCSQNDSSDPLFKGLFEVAVSSPKIGSGFKKALLILLTILLISMQLCSADTFPEVRSFLSMFKE